MKCDNCFHYELIDWEDDGVTGKATPIYWCEKGIKDCSNCSYYDPIEYDEVCDDDCEHCEWVTCPKMEVENETS